MEKIILPEKFEESVKELFGQTEGQTVIDSLRNEESTVSVRINPRKRISTPLYENMTPVPWANNGFYLPSRPVFTINPLLHAGAFYVQEASSMIYGAIISKLSLESPVKVLDLCAAPGGKSGAAIDALPEGSVLVANEYVPQRANILRENIAKQGYPNTIVTNSPVRKFGRLESSFDLMIADVPCSGEGMMRKEEAARLQWSEGLIGQCAALQREILTEALPALRPGGWLIYSTCTFNRQENEENVKWLIREHGLESVPITAPAEWNTIGSLDPDVHALRFIPGFIKGEGLFVALLRKNSDESQMAVESFNERSPKKKTIKKNRPNSENKPGPVNLGILESWIGDSSYSPYIMSDGSVSAMSPEVLKLAEQLEKNGIRILSEGVELAVVKGREPAPAHALALSTILDKNAFPRVELDLETALAYLRREAIRLAESAPKGYVLVTYAGVPLGFVKNLGSRANNMYPSEWRIRNK